MINVESFQVIYKTLELFLFFDPVNANRLIIIFVLDIPRNTCVWCKTDFGNKRFVVNDNKKRIVNITSR